GGWAASHALLRGSTESPDFASVSAGQSSPEPLRKRPGAARRRGGPGRPLQAVPPSLDPQNQGSGGVGEPDRGARGDLRSPRAQRRRQDHDSQDAARSPQADLGQGVAPRQPDRPSRAPEAGGLSPA